jgi:hypothetical protein
MMMLGGPLQGSSLEQDSSSFNFPVNKPNDPSLSLCSEQLLMQFSFIGAELSESHPESKPPEEDPSRTDDQIFENSAKE